MSFRIFLDLHQFLWSIESHREQRLAWHDAIEARRARIRSEARAEAQLRAMLDANPSGSLGNAKLDDPENLRASGLL